MKRYRLAVDSSTHKLRMDLDEEGAYVRHIEVEPVLKAAKALLADVRRRYPGEELRCPYMRALDQACNTIGIESE